MIRWYDYIVALVLADFLFANVSMAMFAEVWWQQFISATAAYFLWDLWSDGYCRWRLGQERKRGK